MVSSSPRRGTPFASPAGGKGEHAELPIVKRVEKLEQRVDLLETLPARLEAIEAQLLQQRREMQDGFSAIRRDMRAIGKGVRTDLRGEMRAMGEGVRADLHGEMRAIGEGLRADLRGEMHAVADDLRVDLRGEMHAVAEGLRADLRGEMHAMGDGLKAEILVKIEALDDDLRAEMHALHHLTIERIDAGDAETRRYMRVMVEEVITRIEAIREGRRTRKKR